MIRVSVEFDGEGRYSISNEGRVVAPGAGPLPSPPALFLASMGACAGAFAVGYLRARSLPFAGLRVLVESDHVEDPHRLGGIDIQVLLPAPLEPRHVRAITRSVELCTLKQTLAVPPKVAAIIETVPQDMHGNPAA